MFLKDDFITSSLQKYKAKKAFKKFLKKKLKIGLIESLAFNRANRQKGKVIIIAKIDKKVIVRKGRLKQKMKCLCYSKTLAKLIKTLNSKELKDNIFSILN